MKNRNVFNSVSCQIILFFLTVLLCPTCVAWPYVRQGEFMHVVVAKHITCYIFSYFGGIVLTGVSLTVFTLIKRNLLIATISLLVTF